MIKKGDTLLLATMNAGKVSELAAQFSMLPLSISSLENRPGIQEIEETGTTFRENAELKARGFSLQTGHLCLADDSGLEVDALGGAPGVFSSRFAGVEAGYQEKIPQLLTLVDKADTADRRARFVCVMALANASGEILHVAEGICAGSLAESPRGTLGFGYDPIFVPRGYAQTFAELGDDVKREISHRARAAREIIRYLLDFIEE